MTGYRILFKRAVAGSYTINVKDSISEWGIALVNMPSYIPLKEKGVYSNNWKDQNGNDTYIPLNRVYEAAYCTFEFLAKREKNVSDSTTVYSRVSDFINFLSGTYFTYYSEYQKQGRQTCRLEEVLDDASYKEIKIPDGANNVERVEQQLKFKLKFEINDPATNVSLSI